MTIEEALRTRNGKKLVFTNGVFDILHAGHVRYLAYARSLGDMLIVGMNSDASVKTLGKGPGRPVNTLDDRLEVLEALRFVDGVVPFEESTPEELIKILRPEVHVKGGDYKVETMVEAKLVASYGGQVIIAPMVEGRSTTGGLRRIGLE
jgi:rfaE bifunctional protein nucleotidyltransferase chain/domain